MNLVKVGEISQIGENILLGKQKHIARKVNSKLNFTKAIIGSGILLIISIVLFTMMLFPVAIFFLAVAALIFFPSYNIFKRTINVANWTKELKTEIKPEEKVLYYEAPITNTGIKYENERIRENTLIITDKRIIFIYIPLFEIKDLFNKNSLKKIGNIFDYEAYNNKIKELLKTDGLTGIINLSNYCFSLKYSELQKIKINNFWRRIKFITKKGKFIYTLRRNKLDEMRKIFKNYLK